MKGCRSLNRNERRTIITTCKTLKEKAFFVLGVTTGFRVSELCSLKISDCTDSRGNATSHIAVARKSTKGKKSGRTVPFNNKAKLVVVEYVQSLIVKGFTGDYPLFGGQKNKGKIAVNRTTAWRWFKSILERAAISGGRGLLGCHTMRKTFAADMLDLLKGNIQKLQIAMGHKSLMSTVSYIHVDQNEIDFAFQNL